MEKEYSELKVNKVALFKIFSNLDTQSAIVAAIVISLGTFLVSGFVELCNYVYWRSYFNEFKIPMSYFNEAIMHESGIKYSAIAYIPTVIIFRWIFKLLKAFTFYVCGRIRGLFQSRRHRQSGGTEKAVLKIFLYIGAVIFVLYGIFGLLMLVSEDVNSFVVVLYAEFIIFVFFSFCKKFFGGKFEFSEKTYYTIRFAGAMVIIYLILGNVYFSGSIQNYSRNGAQELRIINNEEADKSFLKEKEKSQAQLVLLETSDYYYITDVVVTQKPFRMQIINNDTYRFIEKVNCPVKYVYAELDYIRGIRHRSLPDWVFGWFVGGSLLFIVVFIALISIPIKKEEIPDKI